MPTPQGGPTLAEAGYELQRQEAERTRAAEATAGASRRWADAERALLQVHLLQHRR